MGIITGDCLNLQSQKQVFKKPFTQGGNCCKIQGTSVVVYVNRQQQLYIDAQKEYCIDIRVKKVINKLCQFRQLNAQDFWLEFKEKMAFKKQMLNIEESQMSIQLKAAAQFSKSLQLIIRNGFTWQRLNWIALESNYYKKQTKLKQLITGATQMQLQYSETNFYIDFQKTLSDQQKQKRLDDFLNKKMNLAKGQYGKCIRQFRKSHSHIYKAIKEDLEVEGKGFERQDWDREGALAYLAEQDPLVHGDFLLSWLQLKCREDGLTPFTFTLFKHYVGNQELLDFALVELDFSLAQLDFFD